VHEHELEAVLREIFLRNGSTGAGYTPTIASGQNALFRHYTRNRDRIEDGALVLVDAACEVCFYTADLTRTWPASGRFSSPQRDLYEAVLHAQTEAIAAIAPGATQDDVHRTAVRALTGAMIALGLLKGDVDDRIGDGSYRRYYPHPTCHWLGLDVHDVGWSGRAGAYRPMEPGMVLTVEPGLYVPPDDERAPAALRGIGVCIEDDVVVGPSGPEVLSDGVPRTVDEVERACRS
jgi:Xaa-Pro aminopeptidase